MDAPSAEPVTANAKSGRAIISSQSPASETKLLGPDEAEVALAQRRAQSRSRGEGVGHRSSSFGVGWFRGPCAAAGAQRIRVQVGVQAQLDDVAVGGGVGAGQADVGADERIQLLAERLAVRPGSCAVRTRRAWSRRATRPGSRRAGRPRDGSGSLRRRSASRRARVRPSRCRAPSPGRRVRAELQPGRRAAPRAFAAVHRIDRLDEPEPRERAQVVAAVRCGRAHDLSALAGRLRAERHQVVEEREAQRMREGTERAHVGDLAAHLWPAGFVIRCERHVSHYAPAQGQDATRIARAAGMRRNAYVVLRVVDSPATAQEAHVHRRT